MPTIKNNWNAKRGDMLYGVGPTITDYLITIYQLTGRNTWQQAHLIKEVNHAAINGYNRTINNHQFRVQHGLLEANLQAYNSINQQDADYLLAMRNHPKYNLLKSTGYLNDPKLISALQKGNDSIHSASSHVAIRSAAAELAIRRSCKFGIRHAIQQRAVIHYLLDGMDMKKVAEKTTFDKTIDLQRGVQLNFKKISICTSELRYLFRNWHWIAPTQKVKFYRNKQEVNAPWTDDFYKSSFDGWAIYAHHLVDKSKAAMMANAKSTHSGLGIVYFLQHINNQFASYEKGDKSTSKKIVQNYLALPAVMIKRIHA